jgi:hypothetical protein
MPARTSNVLIRTSHSIAQGATSQVCVITFRLSAAAPTRLRSVRGSVGRMLAVSWVFVGLLAGAVLVLLVAEWPRLSERLGIEARLEARERRARAQRKAKLRVVRDESEDFEASVRRDLERLPTIEKPDRKR